MLKTILEFLSIQEQRDQEQHETRLNQEAHWSFESERDFDMSEFYLLCPDAERPNFSVDPISPLPTYEAENIGPTENENFTDISYSQQSSQFNESTDFQSQASQENQSQASQENQSQSQSHNLNSGTRNPDAPTSASQPQIVQQPVPRPDDKHITTEIGQLKFKQVTMESKL